MDVRKLQKKIKRKEVVFLSKQPGLVTFQGEASCFVLVHNGGLVNGLSRAAIQLILPAACNINMPTNRDYCYVTFSSVREAEESVEAKNGICVQAASELRDLLPVCLKDGPPLHLYLSYISDLPHSNSSIDRGQPSEDKHPALVPENPPIAPSYPPGLVLLQEFVSPSEELELLSWLKQEFASDVGTGETLKQRQVMHYGYKFDYSSNSVDHTQPLPGAMPTVICDIVVRILATGEVDHKLDQVTVNLYPPGSGIPPHVDTHSVFMDNIVSLSLGSQVVMEFCKVSKECSSPRQPVLLPARSLLVMKDASRYGYTHAIPARTFDPVPSLADGLNQHSNVVAMTTVPRETRISVTFRGVRSAPCVCHCDFPLSCDSQHLQHKS